MSKLSCIIVEDEPLAAKILTEYIAQLPFLELRGTFKDGMFASEFLRENTVDLMFLDIHLPKLRGMAFLKTLQQPPAVIITTAYHQYAVEGFEQNVTDYLLKPFDFERFLAAVNKVHPAKTNNRADTEALKKDCVFLTVHNKKVKILFNELLYVESQREYVRIVTETKEYRSKMSTHEIEAILPAESFWRIHRSFIVHVDKIEAYTAEHVEIRGISIPIGRGYKANFGDL